MDRHIYHVTSAFMPGGGKKKPAKIHLPSRKKALKRKNILAVVGLDSLE